MQNNFNIHSLLKNNQVHTNLVVFYFPPFKADFLLKSLFLPPFFHISP